MTRERAKELLPIIAAFAEGKEIQSRHKDCRGDPFLDIADPSWDVEWVYRVKPPEPREFWITANGFESLKGGLGHGERIRVREVID